ncbi:MAG: ABC transporter permease, partial [Pseudomonadota bacterium]
MTASLRFGYWLLIAPALGAMLIFYVWPLVQVLWLSVTEPYPGLQNYERLGESRVIHRIMWTTLEVCVLTTMVTVILGYVVAYAMTIVGEGQRTGMMFCVLLSLWLSVLIRAFAWVMLLRGNGVVNEGLMGIGLIDQPLRLVRNEIGVLIGMVHFMLPLAVLPIFANMTGIEARLISAARGLGASPARAFLLVFLPL